MAQQVEAAASNPVQCPFESDRAYQIPEGIAISSLRSVLNTAFTDIDARLRRLEYESIARNQAPDREAPASIWQAKWRGLFRRLRRFGSPADD